MKIGQTVQKLQQNIDIQDGGRRHLEFRKMTKWPISTSWNLHSIFFYSNHSKTSKVTAKLRNVYFGLDFSTTEHELIK
jgi:hypothetical protein